ncbi:IclR family transcriptional regulator [Pseudonocardia alni]|uniref:IclR family transcriptional regulator n=1 Tax=Pseudonocardia alni TaxID=33907 RepID=UPI0033DFC02B
MTRTLAILDLFADGQAHRIVDLVRATDLQTSTVHRLVRTLARAGWLEQASGGGAYRLSLRAAIVGRAAVDGFPGTQAADVLAGLRDRLDVGVSFGIPGRRVAHLLVQFPADRAVTVPSGAREAGPLHTCAMARVFLAHGLMSLDAAGNEPYRRYTEHTVRRRADLEVLVGTCREIGHAVSADEYLPGTTSVAVPVRTADGAVVAALSVEGDTDLFDPEFTTEGVDALHRAAPLLARTP